MTYRPKLRGLFKVLEKYNNHDVPKIASGHLNLYLREPQGSEFVEFTRTELGLERSRNFFLVIEVLARCV